MQVSVYVCSTKSDQHNENLLDEPVSDIKEPVLTSQPAPSYFNRMKKYVSDVYQNLSGTDGLIGF